MVNWQDLSDFENGSFMMAEQLGLNQSISKTAGGVPSGEQADP